MLPFLSHYDFTETQTPENSEKLAHIRVCRERRGVEVCSGCPYFDSCELLKSYLREQAGYKDSEGGGTQGG